MNDLPMAAWRLLGPSFVAGGVIVLAIAFLRGEASLALVVVFPVITATGALAALGISLIVAGCAISFLAWPLRLEAPSDLGTLPAASPSREASPGSQPSRRWGGVLFLGPVPIVFGSSPQVTRVMLVLALVLFLALLGFAFFLLR